MKTITLASFLILAMNFTAINAQDTKANTIKEFLTDVISLENERVSSDTPIKSFNEIAKTKAAKTIIITKENIKESLTEAKDYKYCVITVGLHTIVKVSDFENCIQSGSWGTCMPYAEGYIQKGSLVPQKDYLNNIIGRPDAQERMMFLFN
ncbi:MAG: hypothetical protein KAT48_08435 [Bacteroidales bacterium]|nr:hypothetical protein [Bacteroidales bacterium]